ncbi:MAG TPA: hypothetical protein DCM07_27630 [Planctomycetaceae bacterium]|nr:hypothetical protein [Gimesia sp.]HAH48547.1 hypothetical protein [Planctomycetaceae bacterium]
MSAVRLPAVVTIWGFPGSDNVLTIKIPTDQFGKSSKTGDFPIRISAKQCYSTGRLPMIEKADTGNISLSIYQ